MRGLRTRRAPRSRKREKPVVDESGNMVFSIVAVVVIFGSLLGTVIVQTVIVQNRVRLDAVNVELEQAREQHQQLRLEVIELQAPERILATAVERLGMTRPAERTYLPGTDPNLEAIVQPGPGDPFGAGALPDFLQAGNDSDDGSEEAQ